MLLEALYPNGPNRNPQRTGEVLYHKDIGFPDDAILPKGFSPVVRLNYGGHARQEAMQEKYGTLRLPAAVDIRKGEIIEIGVEGKMVTKMVVRFPYDQVKDIVIVIMIPTGFVKTVWANLKTDKHKTLDRSRYEVPRKAAHA